MRTKILFLIFIFCNHAFSCFAQCKLRHILVYKSELDPNMGLSLNNITGKGWNNNYKIGFFGGLSETVYIKKIGVSISADINSVRYNTDKYFNDLSSKYFNKLADTNKVDNSFGITSLTTKLIFYYRINGKVNLGAGPGFTYFFHINDMQKILINDNDVFNSSEINVVLYTEFLLSTRIKFLCEYSVGVTDINETKSSLWKQNTLLIGLKYSLCMFNNKLLLPRWLH